MWLSPRPWCCCLGDGPFYLGHGAWPVCFTRCCAVFVVSPLCFQKAQSFCNYFLHVCSKELLLPFAYFQLLTDNVSYSLGNAGKKKPPAVESQSWVEGSRDLQKGYLRSPPSSSAKHPSRYHSRRLQGGFTFGRFQRGLKRFEKGLKRV